MKKAGLVTSGLPCGSCECPSAAMELGIAPFLWFLLTLRGSSGQNHAALQEIEACPP